MNAKLEINLLEDDIKSLGYLKGIVKHSDTKDCIRTLLEELMAKKELLSSTQ